MLINKPESVRLRHFDNSKVFNEYWNGKDNIYKNIDVYDSNKKRKILTVFDERIADILNNKKSNPRVTELQSKHSSCFSHATLFCCTKKIRLNYTQDFIIRYVFSQRLR